MSAKISPLRLLWICGTALLVGWIIGGTGLLSAIEQRVAYVASMVALHDDAADGIVLVPITQDDYKNQFKGQRPLDAEQLRRLIERIGADQPAAIGVDIDTSPEAFTALRSLDLKVPLIWARAATGTEEPVLPSPVLGYSRVEVEGSRVLPAGIAFIPEDEDGIVRAHTRRFQTPFGEQPSFACAILIQCATGAVCRQLPDGVRRQCREGEAGRQWLIDYRDSSRQQWTKTAVSAGQLLDGSFASSDVFRGRIVLIGSAFIESGDVEHPTPLGETSGIELLAQVLATELRGGGANPAGTIITGILIAFETYLILIVLDARTFRQRIGVATALVVLMAALTSLVNDGHLRRTGHFAVMLLFVLLLQFGLRHVENGQERFLEWFRSITGRSSPDSTI